MNNIRVIHEKLTLGLKIRTHSFSTPDLFSRSQKRKQWGRECHLRYEGTVQILK